MTEYLDFARELADAAAAAAMPHFRTRIAVENKEQGAYDPVTIADRAAERAMRDMIHARYPEHGIVGEEEGIHQGSSPYHWVLDPVDGTRSFICGLPLWGTLIALNDGRRPVAGAMYQPFTREFYAGTPDGSWLNGERLRTRPCADLAQARVMTTAPELFRVPAQRAAWDALAADAQLVRFGADCYAYCMLAAGHIDAVVEAGLKPFDIQALIPIIEGAGGIVTSWDGGDAQHGGTILACGDPALHAHLVERLRSVAN
ncbi:histidinol-phosphatase [Pseudoduganella lutea]|uniref:Histidinol-phosphatase n=1 Tax=Pseudoduganella lutea TaxID=321985 RepID=A0A4V0Z427_9BURK|nr:histidinol-phosphatase [Pseudoduganella lutea]QBE65483.1 histidinol-phosphatase [Pseudoduganella lutea]